uniref:Uncharacterized protein n=1 Tax=Caenorhabditis japonica TaxID=281687 RepID=A0A8R1IBN1_CAEJA
MERANDSQQPTQPLLIRRPVIQYSPRPRLNPPVLIPVSSHQTDSMPILEKNTIIEQHPPEPSYNKNKTPIQIISRDSKKASTPRTGSETKNLKKVVKNTKRRIPTKNATKLVTNVNIIPPQATPRSSHSQLVPLSSSLTVPSNSKLREQTPPPPVPHPTDYDAYLYDTYFTASNYYPQDPVHSEGNDTNKKSYAVL